MGSRDKAGVDRTRPLYTVVHNDKKRVAYFYDSDIGNYAYVTGHPMKPHRIRLAHSLVMNYGVYKFLEVYRAKPAVFMEMTQFHTDEYIDFLQKVTPDNMDNYLREQSKYNVGDDCPVFDGLFEFCGISAGGSMEGAARLNRNKCDIAINWAGGLHHAKKSEASGFCYVNDIVLAIIELLRFNKRVLYIDIDVHHGDGVEEAFYTTDRVMTCSFHKYGEYFPGTGELRDIGIGTGKNYAVNFPLRDGITDESYKTIFEPVISAIMQYYQPDAVVLQCGSDSLSGDRLGCFNLSMRGHANCVNFVRTFGLPTLVLGGGGYTMRNVARTWAYETGRLVGVEMDSALPYNEYYDYYGPDYELDVRSSNMENANNEEYLEKIKIAVIENLKKTAPVPSVQMQDIPRQSMGMTDEEEAELDDLDEDDNENKDRRMTQRQWEKHRARQDEFEDSDDEEMAQANGVNYEKPARRTILDFRNPNTEYDMDSGAATPVPNGAAAAAAVAAAAAAAAAATATNGDGEKAAADVDKAAPAAATAEDAKPEASTTPSETKDVAMEDADANDAAATLTSAAAAAAAAAAATAAAADSSAVPAAAAADAADEDTTKMEVDEEAPAAAAAAVPEADKTETTATNGASTTAAAPEAATVAKPAAVADDDVEMADVASDEPAAPTAAASAPATAEVTAVDTAASAAAPDGKKDESAAPPAAAAVAGDAETTTTAKPAAETATATTTTTTDDAKPEAKPETETAAKTEEEPAAAAATAATTAATAADGAKTTSEKKEASPSAAAVKKDEAASSASEASKAVSTAATKETTTATTTAASAAAEKATEAGSEAAAKDGKAASETGDAVKMEQA